MGKRTFKFYRQNEKEIMESLGLKPTINSGSTWIEKEDGQNEYVICQLKSTDAQSISVKQKDLRTLEYNAMVAHKIPMFAIQFLNTDEVWLMVKPQDISDVVEYINTGKCEKPETIEVQEIKKVNVKKINSSEQARVDFRNEMEQRYDKTKSAL